MQTGTDWMVVVVCVCFGKAKNGVSKDGQVSASSLTLITKHGKRNSIFRSPMLYSHSICRSKDDIQLNQQLTTTLSLQQIFTLRGARLSASKNSVGTVHP